MSRQKAANESRRFANAAERQSVARLQETAIVIKPTASSTVTRASARRGFGCNFTEIFSGGILFFGLLGIGFPFSIEKFRCSMIFFQNRFSNRKPRHSHRRFSIRPGSAREGDSRANEGPLPRGRFDLRWWTRQWLAAAARLPRSPFAAAVRGSWIIALSHAGRRPRDYRSTKECRSCRRSQSIAWTTFGSGGFSSQ